MPVIETYDILRSYMRIRTKTVTLRVPEWVNDALEYLAKELGIPKSELLRNAVMEYLEEVGSVSGEADTREVRPRNIIFV